MLLPTFLCQDPRPIRHRWLVAHVLTMATFQISHPIAKFIQMITSNWLLHGASAPVSFSTYVHYKENPGFTCINSTLC